MGCYIWYSEEGAAGRAAAPPSPLLAVYQMYCAHLPFNVQIKTAEQRTIILQYSDWYTGRRWVGCYIWYSHEGPKRAGAPPSSFLALPDVTS